MLRLCTFVLQLALGPWSPASCKAQASSASCSMLGSMGHLGEPGQGEGVHHGVWGRMRARLRVCAGQGGEQHRYTQAAHISRPRCWRAQVHSSCQGCGDVIGIARGVWNGVSWGVEWCGMVYPGVWNGVSWGVEWCILGKRCRCLAGASYRWAKLVVCLHAGWCQQQQHPQARQPRAPLCTWPCTV